MALKIDKIIPIIIKYIHSIAQTAVIYCCARCLYLLWSDNFVRLAYMRIFLKLRYDTFHNLFCMQSFLCPSLLLDRCSIDHYRCRGCCNIRSHLHKKMLELKFLKFIFLLEHDPDLPSSQLPTISSCV